MTTFCILCRKQIPAKRQRRAAATCSSACANELRRLRRSERSRRSCRLCGRVTRSKSSSEPVLMEHSGITNRSKPENDPGNPPEVEEAQPQEQDAGLPA